MADISDVENALVAAISAALYPNGAGGASAAGLPCRIYRGWPNGRALDDDLAGGVASVTIFGFSYSKVRKATRHCLERR